MLGENGIIFALLVLVAAGLGILYYSVSLTASAETEIQNIGSFPIGSLVTISGQITKVSKSSSGNIYWTVQDGTGSITISLLGKIANDYSSVKKDMQVVISGLVSEYKNSLEITPKTIEVKND